MNPPTPGDTITVTHTCRLHPTPLSAAFDVERVVRLNDGGARIETTRCDGTRMHVIYEADGWEKP